MTAGPDGQRRRFSLPRCALALFAVAIAHCATAVTFGHSVTNALENLAEDSLMIAVPVMAVATVRSRLRR
ncbi:hypothetical protein [Actinacidiphila acidipaludis]|uniref:Uncharacterized protein n=1 Tax=Actinacidiphila acidipaludis TaxID=2873382 RepID=A0ABS7QHA1_9ACTN|nr:hypothetical protein [Streptomyces acidipaludis]MBY8882551.1 hypothetical protein [Streptomyces acidipaludis]